MSSIRPKCNSCFSYLVATKVCPCGHRYCCDCLKNMVLTGLNDRSLLPIKCCGKEIEIDICIGVVDISDSIKYIRAVEEYRILNKMYCPQKECSVCIDLDQLPELQALSFNCPSCDVVLCKKCRVSHPNLTCDQYLTLPDSERNWEDVQMHNFAAREQLARCPQCSHYIERNGGCPNMICRCGKEFTYQSYWPNMFQPRGV